jgi:hypothetical protein
VFLGDSGGILPSLIKSAEAREKSEKKSFWFSGHKNLIFGRPGAFLGVFRCFPPLVVSKGLK